MLALLLWVVVVFGWPPEEQIVGPASQLEWKSWLQAIQVNRTSMLASINYNGSIFSVPQLAWTRTAYMEPQTHPFDRYFYDPVNHVYTVDIYLDDLEKR